MKKTTIGGQALIEGVMMKGPDSIAIAVRNPEGEIVLDKKKLKDRGPIAKVPVIRGIVEFFRIMVVGVKSLMYSAEVAGLDDDGTKDEAKEEEKKPSKFDAFLNRVFGDKLAEAILYFSVVLSIGFSVGLFILLPNLVSSLLPLDKNKAVGVFLYNIIEGVLRLGIFFGYIILTSLLKDIRRVWQYHGAEHKTIHCYEHELELTVENVRGFTTRHPRCGTSFLFIVMIMSILVFSLIGWHSIIINILSRIILIPIVAGLSYEVLKFAGRSESKIVGIANMPGLALQYFTAKEPDDDQIEVAIQAFKNVLVADPGADVW